MFESLFGKTYCCLFSAQPFFFNKKLMFVYEIRLKSTSIARVLNDTVNCMCLFAAVLLVLKSDVQNGCVLFSTSVFVFDVSKIVL